MIRKALEKDADSIASIYNHYILNSVATFEEKPLSTAALNARIKKVVDGGYSWLVATENEKLVGYAYSCKWKERSAYRYTAEISVYISDEASSRGYGTKLYQALFNTLPQQGIKVVVAGITLPNAASVALHEKFGMKKIAHFNQVGYKFGQWLDVGFWQLNLNS